MKILSFLLALQFFTLWVLSGVVTVASFILAVFFQYYKLGIIFVLYFCYRVNYRNKPWPAFKKLFINIAKRDAFYKKMELVFHPEV